MTNAVTETAEAIKEALNAAALEGLLGRELTAVRRWLPTIKLENIIGTVALVVARSVASMPATRAKDFEDIGVDVAVFEKLRGNDDEGQADEFFNLLERIDGVIRADVAGGGWIGRNRDPIFDVTALEQNRVLKSSATYTFKVYHDVRL